MESRPYLLQFIESREGFSWREAGENLFRLDSGKWRGIGWRHDVVMVGTPHADAAILYITGGEVNQPDLDEAATIATRSGLPVAMLFHIPNQPLFGLTEDDLIAHTFERYLEEGDPEWPLLFPMTRAVIRCMDMLQQARGIDRFFVTGASKRGWTAWLAAGTGDARIAGVAPMVFDHLDFPRQMAHQLASWGAYSEEIHDYTDRQLPDEVDTERGAELVRLVDPIYLVDRIRCPILVINGANDRYWTADALSNYWDRLPTPKRCLIVPNVGHLLGDKRQMVETLSAFGRLEAGLPEVSARMEFDGETLRTEIVAPEAESRSVWMATSPTLDFRDSDWRTAGDWERPLANFAVMAEARFEGFSLSTPVRVFRPAGPSSPAPDRREPGGS